MEPILEKLSFRKEQSILAFRYAKKSFETPWHFHPQHELTYIEESSGTKSIGDYVGRYEPGELVLLRSNLPHCWKNYDHTKGLAKSTVIQWNEGIFANTPELEPLFRMMKRASRGIIFEKSEVEHLTPEVLKLPSYAGGDLYLGLLSVLLSLSSASFRPLSEASFLREAPLEHNRKIAKVHTYVNTHYDHKIRLRDLGALVNMTEASFSRFFTKMMGRPFFTYLNEFRVNVASRLLIDTDKSVGEIGFSCGYESLPFFYKQFKKHKGLTPHKYRQKHRPKLGH